METSPRFIDTPLLPYERDLISILGCSEEEYKTLLRFNALRARTRPAEYDHIPDIVNDPVTVITTLVVGLAFTAIGQLLTPRPEIPDIPEPKERKRVTQEQLPNDVGPSRFNQTSSFDGYAALVDYGTPVQIPFGKMGTSGDGVLSGGLVLAASLVWSRAYSCGAFQRVKLLYTVGEHILPSPNVKGVWLGTQALSSIGNYEYALYWKSQKGENRIKKNNLIAGTQSTPESGDPEEQDERFIAPVDGTIEGPGFCMVNNPTSKAVFGQYNPVRNGSAHRVNWEVISAPFDPLKYGDPDKNQFENNKMRRARAPRIKVGGEFSGVLGVGGDPTYAGQPGVGRAYGTQMGLVAYARPGQDFVVTQDKINYLEGVTTDWKVKFRISEGNPEDLDSRRYVYKMEGKPSEWGVTHKDIQSALDSRRARADDLMVVGTRWMIGQTQWVVESRTNEIWRPGKVVEVVLRCVATAGAGTIGIAGMRASSELLGGYEGPWCEQLTDSPRPDNISPDGFHKNKHCGAVFWNICMYEAATVRMTRPADTIEFGIKSTVWNQASGLCNFNAIPKCKDLWQKDKDNVNLNTPTLSRYFKRTSCFSIWVRTVPQYQEIDDKAPEWNRIDQVFCVTGDSPRAIYNYIRIRPRIRGLYEFRFIPRVGSDIAINSYRDARFWQLNASGDVIGEDFQTSDYGAFRVTINGQKIACSAVLSNEELVTDPGATRTTDPVDVQVPNNVSAQYWTTSSDWHKNCWLTEVLGPVRPGTHTGIIEHYKPRGGPAGDPGWVKIKVQATANNLSGPKHLRNFGTKLNWAGNGSGIKFSVIQDSYTRGQWAVGDLFQLTKTISSGNRYAPYNPPTIGVVLRVSSVTNSTIEGELILGDDERAFELASQVSDCSHYDEITKSCDSSPEHSISYVNTAVSEADGEGTAGIPQYSDLAMLGLTLKSGPSIGSIEQPRVWVNGGIGVDRLVAISEGQPGVFGISNLLSDLINYMLTNKTQGIGELIPADLVDTKSLTETGKFLLQNKIFWNGVVETGTNFRSFATDQASKSLCFFTIKNGVFGMMPALPVDSGFEISKKAVPVSGIFGAGNIIDGSLKLTFVSSEERRPIGVTVRWRNTAPYELPEEMTALVRFKDTEPDIIEDYDLSTFCDNEYQALMAARYALSTRKFIDHSIEFETTPEAVGVEPGSYIKVFTEETYFQSDLVLKINSDGTFTSPAVVEDGTYRASAYVPDSTDVKEVELVIKGQVVQNTDLDNAIVSIFQVAPTSRIYQIAELTLNEDGLVNINATYVPTRADGSSEVAYYTTTPSMFEVIR